MAANPQSPPESSADAVPNADAPSSKSRGRLFFAAGVAGVWILGLIVLAVLTANPVTLNREQILRSDYVVTARREAADSPVLIVQKEWKHAENLDEVTITNLDEVQMAAGPEFLVPLERIGPKRFLITPTTLPNRAPLIYRATPEAEAQLKEVLDNHKTSE